jgi:hypothetical protein
MYFGGGFGQAMLSGRGHGKDRNTGFVPFVPPFRHSFLMISFKDCH